MFAATVVPSGTELPFILVQKPVAIPMFTIFSVRTIRAVLRGGEWGHSGGGTHDVIVEYAQKGELVSVCLTLNLHLWSSRTPPHTPLPDIRNVFISIDVSNLPILFGFYIRCT